MSRSRRPRNDAWLDPVALNGLPTATLTDLLTLDPALTAIETGERERVTARFRRYADDPVGFVTDPAVLGEHLWSKQREILEAVRDYRYTAVQSSHGTGKSFLAGRVVCWWLSSFPPGDAFAVTTAPTFPQVRAVLWREVVRAHDRAHLPGRTNQTEWLIGNELIGVGRKPSDYSVAGFQGIHARRVLVVVDEACGVIEGLWDAIDSLVTNEDSRVLAIGNPDDPLAHFAKVCRPGSGYHRIKISSFDTPNLTGEPVPEALRALLPSKTWVEERRRRWGEQSPVYISKVLGEFPDVSDDALIPVGWVTAAVNRDLLADADPYDLLPSELGVDVARFGCFDDKTEILTDDGWKLFQNLLGSERVLTQNSDGAAEWGLITKVHRYPYVGLMNLFDGCLNFCVTDNHKFLVRKNRNDPGYVLRPLCELPNNFEVCGWVSGWNGVPIGKIEFTTAKPMPNGGFGFYRHEFTGTDWAEFLGWFISEGHVSSDPRDRRDGIQFGETGRYGVGISQNPGRRADKIKALLTRMGIRWRQANPKQITFASQSIGKHLIRYCGHGAVSKRVPVYMKNASLEEIRAFLDAFLAGDGSAKADGKGRCYGTSSWQLADDIQEMIVKTGSSGLLRHYSCAGTTSEIFGRTITRTSDMYTVFERSPTKHVKVGQPAKTCDRHVKDFRSKVQRVFYHGDVWCVSTPNKIICVRREGMPMWSGNSDESVVIHRRGPVARIVGQARRRDLMHLVGLVLNALRTVRPMPSRVKIDDTGLGGGVTDRLREVLREHGLAVEVVPVIVGSSPSRVRFAEKFYNLRAEIAWNLRELFESGLIDLEADEELLAQVTSLRYLFDSRGRIRLEEKSEAKNRGLPSPDRADALILAYADIVRPRRLAEARPPSPVHLPIFQR